MAELQLIPRQPEQQLDLNQILPPEGATPPLLMIMRTGDLINFALILIPYVTIFPEIDCNGSLIVGSKATGRIGSIEDLSRLAASQKTFTERIHVVQYDFSPGHPELQRHCRRSRSGKFLKLRKLDLSVNFNNAHSLGKQAMPASFVFLVPETVDVVEMFLTFGSDLYSASKNYDSILNTIRQGTVFYYMTYTNLGVGLSKVTGGYLVCEVCDFGFEFNKRKQKVRRFKEALEALEEDVVSQGLWE